MGLRGLRRLSGVCLLVVLILPCLALVPASVIDRGPGGWPRASAFPIALAVFDPFVWICVRNSAMVAGLVAVGSMVAGVSLGIIAGRWRFWGRGPLWALGLVSMAGGPLLVAPGVLILMGGDRAWDWLAARSFLGLSCEDLGRWFGLIWVGIACGAPIVALTTVDALRRVESSWSEAALAIGATRWRAWWDVVWPSLRPDVASASASVFVLTLVEPAGPMILELDRTLAVQIVDAARRLDQPTRAVTLALMAVGVAIAARVGIGVWSGISTERVLPTHPTPRRSARSRLGLGLSMILGGWLAISFAPVLATLGWAFADPRGLASPLGWSSMARGWLSDPGATTWLINSLMTGALAVALNLLIVASFHGGKPRSSEPLLRGVARALPFVPPLALGVGSMAIPWLMGGLAEVVGTIPARWLRAMALELSPARSPSLLLVVTLAASRLPMLVRVAELSRSQARPVLVEAAMLLGESGRRLKGPRLIPIRVVILTFVLASTSLAPAQVLTPSSESRTLAPALLGLLLHPDGNGSRASGPIAVILVANLLAFAVASRWRVAGIGDWFRG